MNENSIFSNAFRSPPANTDAELALLGAILTNNKAFARVEDILEPDYFAVPLYGRVYEICRNLINSGIEASPITVKSPLEGDPLLGRQKVGEVFAIILKSVVGWLNARDYGSAIRDAWVRRTLFKACTETIDLCCVPGDAGAPDIVDMIETRLLSLARGMGEEKATVSLASAMEQARLNAIAASARGDGLAGTTWGYKALNRMTGGLLPGAVYVLGARPAMGKTSLGFGIATRAAAAGSSTLFWSGEMTPDQIGARAGAAWADLSTQSVFAGRRYDIPEDLETGERLPLESWQWRDLEAGEKAAASLPLEIDSQPAITVARLRSRARRMARSRTGLHLLVVDYIALMSSGSEHADMKPYERITIVSRQLKQLAQELQVPIIVLAQLNRENERREDKRPQLADLRDSGAIEQDADVVMFLHREHYYLKKQADAGVQRKDRETNEDYANRCSALAQRASASEGKAEVIIAKNRQGPTGTCHLRFTDHTTWFRDTTEDERSPAWSVPTGDTIH
ncbi:AAA family ATPase [Acetobacter sicerae]|uniref:DNA 5'-3' helicase n=1 Tax=Acetobacter sicerae TaxID=85325 RepID=A0ABS8VUQ1_9PROT|nr:DnaB-like helicase C-terminal domain-containing protein [Acetobacter sicerae]MCE0743349.1 AAA family ATPase [Acetobacter sicerae]